MTEFTPEVEADEDLQGRSCLNCACSFLVKKPRIMPPGIKKDVFDAMQDQRVCRLDPPEVVRNSITGTQGVSQRPVLDGNVCWHWKPRGTLPGESYEAKRYIDQVAALAEKIT